MNPSSQLPAQGDLHATRQALQSGRTSPGEIIERAAAIAQSGACRHVFLTGAAESPPFTAEALTKAAFGNPAQPLAAIPVSIKDLFDVAGQTTTAGSTVLADAAAAGADCPAVARLRAAGAVLAGRTNMVEFAFSGVGINPHYGTPVNPADSAVRR